MSEFVENQESAGAEALAPQMSDDFSVSVRKLIDAVAGLIVRPCLDAGRVRVG